VRSELVPYLGGIPLAACPSLPRCSAPLAPPFTHRHSRMDRRCPPARLALRSPGHAALVLARAAGEADAAAFLLERAAACADKSPMTALEAARCCRDYWLPADLLTTAASRLFIAAGTRTASAIATGWPPTAASASVLA
jgi:hypothetical protein